MSVKRYKVEELNCCFDADMIESPTGEYVEYSDYEKLKAEVDSLYRHGDLMLMFAAKNMPYPPYATMAKDWLSVKESRLK